MSQSVEMSSDVINKELEKFLSVLNRETAHTLSAIQSNLLQLSGPKRDEFKIGFLKSANYQLMGTYKVFEMKLMMNVAPNNGPNSMDFLLMPPPNMQMNTPFVMSGERMADARGTRSNATPFLVNRNPSDHIMDLDFEPTNWNANTSRTNDFGKSATGTKTNDRIVFRTSGVSLANGHAGTVNGLTNEFPSASKTSDHQFKVPNAHASTLNAAKRNLFNADNDMAMANAPNGFQSSKVMTDSSNSRKIARNIYSDAPNGHENASATTNGPRFVNVSSNPSRDSGSSTNNIFGGHQSQPPPTNNQNHQQQQNAPNDRENSSNVHKSSNFNATNSRSAAENGLFGAMNNFTGPKNPPANHQGAANNNYSENSNGLDKVSKASVFSRLNYNAMEVESSRKSADNQKYEADFTNDNSMDDDGFDDYRHEAVENGDIYVDDDVSEPNNNYGPNNFNGPIKTKAMQKQQTNAAANSFGTAQFTMDGAPAGPQNDGDPTANHRFGDSNGLTNSADFQQKSNKTSKTSRREWMCFYCEKAKESNNQSSKFSTVDQAYDHWKLNHSNESANAETADAAAGAKERGPFRFYPIDLLFCHMDNCGYYSTFQRLQRHHQRNHENDLFVPILNGRCALCLHTGDDLRGHLCDSLRNGMQTKLCTPVLLTAQDLAELQAIESREWKQNRPKKIECLGCGNIFADRHEMTQHHYDKHGASTIDYKYIDADVKPVVTFICNCCNREIQPSKYVDHIKFMAKQRWNKHQQLTYDGWFRQQEMQFLKTKVVFSNGLVLFKQNLIRTDLGNHAGFISLVKKIYNSMKHNELYVHVNKM